MCFAPRRRERVSKEARRFRHGLYRSTAKSVTFFSLFALISRAPPRGGKTLLERQGCLLRMKAHQTAMMLARAARARACASAAPRFRPPTVLFCGGSAEQPTSSISCMTGRGLLCYARMKAHQTSVTMGLRGPQALTFSRGLRASGGCGQSGIALPCRAPRCLRC